MERNIEGVIDFRGSEREISPKFKAAREKIIWDYQTESPNSNLTGDTLEHFAVERARQKLEACQNLYQLANNEACKTDPDRSQKEMDSNNLAVEMARKLMEEIQNTLRIYDDGPQTQREEIQQEPEKRAAA